MAQIIAKIEQLIEYLDDYDQKNHDQPSVLMSIIDDLWINIVQMCNVKSFLSINKTCKHFNNLTSIKNNKKKNYNFQLKQYWKNQCGIICDNFNHEYKHINTNSDNYNWYQMYQEFVIILSSIFVSNHLVKTEENIEKIKANNKHLTKYKECFKHIITAPHISVGQLESDKDILIVPAKLSDVSIYDHLSGTIKIFTNIIQQIIIHDCINLFKLDVAEKGWFKNGYTHRSINSMYRVEYPKFYLDDSEVSLTFFDFACLNGSIKIVKYLLTIMGTNGTCYCNFGDFYHQHTPLMHAVRGLHINIVELLIPIIKNLGNDAINKINVLQENVLNIACQSCYNKCNINIENKSKNREKIVSWLLDAGADVNVITPYQGSALFSACENGYMNIAQMLIKHPMIKENIDKCGWNTHKDVALFLMMGKALCKNSDDMAVSNLQQFIQFIINFGIETQNNRLKNILDIRNRHGKTLMMVISDPTVKLTYINIH